jgi:hypothetical protein
MEIPVCLYAVGVFVRRENPYDAGLPMEKLEAVFSSAYWNMTWGDLGCGGEWTKRPVSLHACSGTHLVIRPHAGFPFSFKESVKEHRDDAAVVASVTDDASALGLASIGCRTEKVRALAIAPRGSAVFVPATADNARNGSYPLTDMFYLRLNHDCGGGFALDALRREFLRYILSREGQEAAVKAGYVAMSAEQAERALAQFGLRPTGEGSWDEMMSRLRARGLPRTDLTRIEHLARRAGDRPDDKQLAVLANNLARTTLTSSVVVKTDEDGAVVKLRLLGQPRAVLTLDPAKGADTKVPIGLYNIWTERDGRETSPSDAWFPVVREH